MVHQFDSVYGNSTAELSRAHIVDFSSRTEKNGLTRDVIGKSTLFVEQQKTTIVFAW